MQTGSNIFQGHIFTKKRIKARLDFMGTQDFMPMHLLSIAYIFVTIFEDKTLFVLGSSTFT